jgi:anthranilate synthase component 1
MTLNLGLHEVIELAKQHKVIPIIQTLFSGTETPVSVFEKLAQHKSGSFLLESADQGVWSRFSFVGVNARGTLTKGPNGVATWKSDANASVFPSKEHAPLAPSALEAVAQVVASWTSQPIDGLPPLTSGLVGMLGWQVIREIEALPEAKPADYASPDASLTMFSDLVIIDHHRGELLLVANIFVTDDFNPESAHSEATERIARMRTELLQPTQPFLADLSNQASASAKHRTSKPEFFDALAKAKEHVKKGDVFQVVISQRFDQPTDASPLDIYRVLRTLNPSPYMYLLNLSDDKSNFSVVGSSPEALVTVSEGRAVMHPIAGSRPRGKTTDEDMAKADDLLADAKEQAEHLMLVDLARNDLLKVCDAKSVAVTEFMQIHRFSHIMHLVSTVEGQVRDGLSTTDVFKATFPAGTLSGAPKPRALEIIEELEPTSRGLFGGVVGYFDFAGNADLAIAIRTAFIRDQIAHVQAGAGIVLDSVDESEYQETITKASATLRAIEIANAMKRIHE